MFVLETYYEYLLESLDSLSLDGFTRSDLEKQYELALLDLVRFMAGKKQLAHFPYTVSRKRVTAVGWDTLSHKPLLRITSA